MEKWKRFERLTAALHALQTRGAIVRWNDHINDYQIDVSIRFNIGQSAHLHIIECRDHRRPVSRDDVAAFCVKVEETNARRGTFVSAAGFQSGARTLAKKRGIELFTLEEVTEDWPAQVEVVIPTPFVRILDVHIQTRGANAWRLVSHGRLAQFLSHARFVGRNDNVLTVDSVVQQLVPADWPGRTGRWGVQMNLRGDWALHFLEAPTVPIGAILVTVETISGSVSVRVRQTEEQAPTRVEYSDTDTTSSTVVAAKDLPYGLDTVLEPGRFYVDVAGNDFFCEAITDGLVDLILLASRQQQKQLWAHVQVCPSNIQGRFVEVTDAVSLGRLRLAYDTWTAAKTQGLTRSVGFVADLEKGAVYTPPGFFDEIAVSRSRQLWTDDDNR
jgi:hypothetical protein